MKSVGFIAGCLLVSVLGGSGQAAGQAAASEEAERPKVLFLLVDDLGPEWLSCYGSETHKTPQIDRLAEGGMRFENVWATPLCTPTRLQLYTGRYPFRTGWVVHNDVPRWGAPYFDWKREVCLVRTLREGGYATAIAGKWQINDLRETGQPEALKEHGFDEHCMWPGFEAGNPPAAERYWDPYLQINGRREIHKGKFGPDIMRQFLIDFMTRNKNKPFFAYYSMVLTHTPMTKTPHNLDTKAQGAALHPGMLDYVDFEVSELMKTLRELGIDRRTIVIFTTDNGSTGGLKATMRGREVKGGKTKVTETGIHVPLIVNCPGRIEAGAVRDELVDFSDLLPTMLDLAGLKPPSNVVLDGRSFAPVLRGDMTDYVPKPWIYSQLGKNRVVRDKRFKLWSNGKLYDLAADPLEQNDLSGSDDPVHVAARQRLQAVFDSLPPETKLPFTRNIDG